MCKIEEKDEKHIMFCRVIFGNLEKFEFGSQQLFLSSLNFYTGVHELSILNCMWYVVAI